MPEFVASCRAEDVPEGRGRIVELNGLMVAVFRSEGTYHALLNRCPHGGGSIGEGWVEDGEAVCPEHFWRFKLATGRCTNVRGNTAHRFACEVRDGVVWVAV